MIDEKTFKEYIFRENRTKRGGEVDCLERPMAFNIPPYHILVI
jgi:hypothetical protein